MTRTASTMLALGTTAPDFSLSDVVSGKAITRDQAAGPRGLLVMFLCAHCPFVQHVNQELGRLGRDYAGRGIGIVAISSNDPDSHPDDAPPGLRRQAEEHSFQFPYLFDESQHVARAYQAACTPDFFLFDAEKSSSIEASSTAAVPAMKFPWMAAICAQRWTRCWPARQCPPSSSPALVATSNGNTIKAVPWRRQKQ